MTNLQKYIDAFSRLKRGSTQNYGLAPHKPILLLTLMDLFETEEVPNNRFYMNDQLVYLFEENWKLLVRTGHVMDIKQPFYHLQMDQVDGIGFWIVKDFSGNQVKKVFTSLFNLVETVDYAEMSPALMQLLLDAGDREVVRDALLSRYFPELKENYYRFKNQPYVQEERILIIKEIEKNYKHISKQIEKDIFVRSRLFKYYISELYNDTCAMTGMQIRSDSNHYFTEACHIVPFYLTQNDHPSNGIALCPNLHRAFDRGLVAVDENYRILVSSKIKEGKENVYSLANLKGTKIKLPKQKEYRPSLENFLKHREEVFRG